MNREESKICAIDTVECINMGRYFLNGKNIYISHLIEQMLERTKLYREEPLYINRAKYENEPKIIFSNKTTTGAANNLVSLYGPRHYKVGVLNFASAKHPGGGFLRGALAQEESIARVSTLYPSLVKYPEFYNHNLSLKTSLYSDYIIYSEGVSIFKDDYGDYLKEPYNIDVITSPAPNAGAVRSNEKHNISKIYPTMENRIRKIIQVAVLNNIDCLVLGAFGCGVFANNLNDVAEIFRKVLIEEDYQRYFKVIEFAIYDRNPSTYIEFEEIFRE